MTTTTTTLRAVVAAALVLGVPSGCAAGGTPVSEDAAGLTQEDVAGLTLHQEFDRYRERHERMQRVLAALQRAVHDGEWDWNGGDDVPLIGGDGEPPLAGADVHNSYALEASRAWDPAGARGSRADLGAVSEYAARHGWDARVDHVGATWYLDTRTDDGWHVEYLVQPSGHYSLTVTSGLFWTNDADALTGAVAGRVPRDVPDHSPPGEYLPAPRWEDPVVASPEP